MCHDSCGSCRQRRSRGCDPGVADFEIGAAVARTREHPLVIGGETGGATNALQRPQDMVVRAGPSMMEAGVDVVPGTVTTHEVPSGTLIIVGYGEGVFLPKIGHA